MRNGPRTIVIRSQLAACGLALLALAGSCTQTNDQSVASTVSTTPVPSTHDPGCTQTGLITSDHGFATGDESWRPTGILIVNPASNGCHCVAVKDDTQTLGLLLNASLHSHVEQGSLVLLPSMDSVTHGEEVQYKIGDDFDDPQFELVDTTCASTGIDIDQVVYARIHGTTQGLAEP